MKIRLSKSQWEKIGNKAGWTKTAQFYENTNDVESFRYEGESDIDFRARLLKNKQMAEQEYDGMQSKYSDLTYRASLLKKKMDEKIGLIESIDKWLREHKE